jgi:tetratricopeptide (TPR) repeat protein
MISRSISSGLMIFSLSCAIAFAAPPPEAKHAAPAKPHAASSRPNPADVASRAQLASELAEFQSNPQDTILRGRIVELAKSLNPAPAIPQLAQDDFSKAVAQLSAASTPDSFDTVAQLFEQVAVQAPWYADAYFNAASAYTKANRYEAARRNLALYLAALRPGVDTRNAEQLRRDLDRKQALQFQQALQQFTANPTDSARMHVIQLAQALGTMPEIPEEARGHYVMAVVFGNSAEDGADYEHAITEYKAALLTAPWWGDAYKKLASAQTMAGRFDDAVTSLIFYQTVNPADTRATQDEIYRLKALAKTTGDEQAKKQELAQQRKLKAEQRITQRAATEAMTYTVEGTWYPVIAPTGYFVGGESAPNCDYVVKQVKERWDVRSTCTPAARSISDVDVQPRQLTFKLRGKGSDFPFSEVNISFALSSDGQTLEGRAVTYDKSYFAFGDHPVRWARRK